MKPTITTDIRSQLAELAAHAEQRDLAARELDRAAGLPTRVEHFTLPSFWASYIINRDSSSLFELDRKEVDRCLDWIHDVQFEKDGSTLYPVSILDDSRYQDDNDWDNIGGMVSTYVFHYGPRG